MQRAKAMNELTENSQRAKQFITAAVGPFEKSFFLWAGGLLPPLFTGLGRFGQNLLVYGHGVHHTQIPKPKRRI
jgi:hypothetical protein